MTISWLGLSCFEITTKTSAGEAKIVIDPYDNATGLRFPRTLEADALLSSHNDSDANNFSAVSGQPFIIKSPGEYEVKDVFFFALSAPAKVGEDQTSPNLIFRLEAEQMNLAHLGALNRELTDQETEQMQNVDILMIPVGGHRVMSAKTAASVVAQIEPRIIIPMTYDLPNLKEKLEAVDDFNKELRVFRRESSNKYKVTRKDLPEEETIIMILER
ncbi:MBL fold metallo-hydrolase [Patescibacteria group bacterium]|nr:MBL fold metallo-hydrolase [Patescibacteria group bacterium]MBU1705286.1 MBL fold metallo-hydrolase [Patescibacteria group bacterium]